jgi:hypothetical protein
VRSSPRSGTDGGRPIRSAPMADLAAAAELAVMRHFDRLKCAVEKRSGFASRPGSQRTHCWCAESTPTCCPSPSSSAWVCCRGCWLTDLDHDLAYR